MKKILLTLVAILLLFAGCQREEKNVTLEMMYWDNVQKPIIDETIAEFEAENPGISVNASVVPWGQYWSKLRTTTVAGNAPDVFWMNVPNFLPYTSNDVLLNLQPYLDNDGIDTSVYPSALIEKYSLDGDTYVIPEQFDTIALVYNKKMFDEAGLSYPDESWDWNTLREAAIKLTKKTDNGMQYGFNAIPENQAGYYNFIVMNGGEIISKDWKRSGFDNPKSIQAIQFLVDLMYKYKCAPDGQSLYELPSAYNMFTSGRVAMTTMGSWYIPVTYEALGNDVDVAPLPKSPYTGMRKSIIHGLGWAGYSRTKNADATWKLIKFLSDKEFSVKMADAGIAIPSYEGTAEGWVNAIPSMNLQVFIDAQKYSAPYPVSYKTAEWASVEGEELKDVWLGLKDPVEAMKTIAEKMNAILATEPN